jgi:hypothetical protein
MEVSAAELPVISSMMAAESAPLEAVELAPRLRSSYGRLPSMKDLQIAMQPSEDHDIQSLASHDLASQDTHDYPDPVGDGVEEYGEEDFEADAAGSKEMLLRKYTVDDDDVVYEADIVEDAGGAQDTENTVPVVVTADIESIANDDEESIEEGTPSVVDSLEKEEPVKVVLDEHSIDNDAAYGGDEFEDDGTGVKTPPNAPREPGPNGVDEDDEYEEEFESDAASPQKVSQ